MATSTGITGTPSPTRSPLRLALGDLVPGTGPHGAWWPQSRQLQTEVADLVDHFPAGDGVVSRLLFSRPDWDDAVVNGAATRKIRAARGAVKAGSFPSDDTHLVILTMASGQRLTLEVIPSDITPAEGRRRLRSAGVADSTFDGSLDQGRWDDESPSI